VDEIKALYRDLVLVRRIDFEAIALQRQGEPGHLGLAARPGSRPVVLGPRARSS
jgi:TPP-dependent pyruvate/acetoin dehydrogenase alpha subunit